MTEYINRDFDSVKQELINYLKTFYPDVWNDYMLPNPSMALLDLMAYSVDILSTEINKRYNELFIDSVTSRYGAFKLAKTLGADLAPVHPSITLVDLSIEVPPTAQGPDPDYVPRLDGGIQLIGGNNTFEIIYDVDFLSDFNTYGIANRKIIPIIVNNNLTGYRIIKREIAISGITKIYKKIITEEEAKPFYSIILPEGNVSQIISIIEINNTDYNYYPPDDMFYDDTKRYYEVENLLQDYIFIKDSNGNLIRKKVRKRFIKEYLPDNKCMITFGGYFYDFNIYEDFLNRSMINDDVTSGDYTYNFNDIYINSSKYGESVKPNTSIFIKYRTGGGIKNNIPTNSLTTLQNLNFNFTGSDEQIIRQVASSIRATNVTPAFGGRDKLNIDEIKHIARSSFNSKKRCVTLNDYINSIYDIDAKYVSVFKVGGIIDDNKVKLYILTKNNENKLNFFTPNLIKQNLLTYLEDKRMINDYVEIYDAIFYNIGIEIYCLVNHELNDSTIKLNIIEKLKEFFDIDKWEMGQTIFVSQIVDLIQEIYGVINVVKIKFYNYVSGNYYSEHKHPQSIELIETGANNFKKYEISLIDNAIYFEKNSFFEIRYPELDIKVSVSL